MTQPTITAADQEAAARLEGYGPTDTIGWTMYMDGYCGESAGVQAFAAARQAESDRWAKAMRLAVGHVFGVRNCAALLAAIDDTQDEGTRS